MKSVDAAGNACVRVAKNDNDIPRLNAELRMRMKTKANFQKLGHCPSMFTRSASVSGPQTRDVSMASTIVLANDRHIWAPKIYAEAIH